MNRDTIIARIHELIDWQFKAQDLVKYNDYIKGVNEAITSEIEFLKKILSEFKS